jgi:hypothetical protein
MQYHDEQDNRAKATENYIQKGQAEGCAQTPLHNLAPAK